MANEENLKPIRSVSEAREMGSKGGKASGEARREKAKLREAMKMLLDNVDKTLSDEDKTKLEALGLDTTNRSRMAVALFESALKGNTKAIQLAGEITGEYTLKQEMNIDAKMEITESPRNEITSRINSIASRSTENGDT